MNNEWKVGGLNDLVAKKKDTSNKEAVNIYLPYDEPSEDTNWLCELARSEDEIDRTGVINFDAASSPEKVLKEATVSYLRHLRNYTAKLAGIFNSYKSLASSGIKIYSIANTEADFMVFRNSLKLIFSAQRPGVIQISFNAHTGAFFTSPTITPSGSAEQIGDVIHAQLGPFNEAIWTYQGRPVNTREMLRYFLSRFIQNSVR